MPLAYGGGLVDLKKSIGSHNEVLQVALFDQPEKLPREVS